MVHMQRAMSDLADEQRAAASGLRGIDYSAVRVAASPSPDAIPDAVARMEEAAESLAELAARIGEFRRRAAAALALMENPVEAAALSRYYLQGWTWERTCCDMGYSYSRMMVIHRSALLHAYDVMPCAERDPLAHAI